MEFTMNVSQQIFVVFFAIIWGTSSNAWPKWKAFHWTLVPFSPRVRLRVLLSFTLLNVVPFLYFVWVMSRLSSSIKADPVLAFTSILRVALPGIAPAFAVFGFYRIWIGVIEFNPLRFYYENDQEMKSALPKLDVENLNGARLDPTKESLNLKDWAWWPNLLFGSLYVILSALVPVLWPPHIQ